METKQSRKKQPEAVRRQILDAVKRITVEQGVPGITLDAVAKLAGVSKGGLLHHFPGRQALVEAMVADILLRLEERIRAVMAADPEPVGRFTRAYILVVTGPEPDEGRLMGSCSLAMNLDPHLAGIWADWLKRMPAGYGEEEHSVTARIIRYAADGIWLDDSTGTALTDPAGRQAVIDRLVAMTRTMEATP